MSNYDKYIKPYLGIYYILIAEFCTSVMLLVTKQLESKESFNNPMSPFQILLIRMVFTFVGTTIYMKWIQPSDGLFGPKKFHRLLIGRGILGTISVLSMYYPLLYISLSDEILIQFLTPIITAVMAAVLLKERLANKEIICGLVSFIGVILIIRPSFLFGQPKNVDSRVETSDPEKRLIATLLVLLGDVSVAGVYIILRFIGDKIHPIYNISYFALISIIACIMASLIIPDLTLVLPNSGKQVAFLLVIGINGFLMQLFFTLGLLKVSASKSAMMMYTQIVFGMFWEFLIWNHRPDLLGWISIIIILSASFFNVYSKDYSSEEFEALPQNNNEIDEEITISSNSNVEEFDMDNFENVSNIHESTSTKTALTP